MQELLRDIIQRNKSRIFLIVLDGLGGLPINGITELEKARIPNLNALARSSACGLHIPVAHGITPGSGPGHLSIFGYDPIRWQIGRGILEALGLGMEIRATDIALRANYATIDNDIIKDRRAQRIATDISRKLTERLQAEIKEIDGVRIIFSPGMEHRFAVVMRFPYPLKKGASDVTDTDPQQEGNPPLEPKALSPEAEEVKRIASEIVKRASESLKDEPRANFILLRGFSMHPDIPNFYDIYGLKALAIANYPMYRGIAKLLSMDAPDIQGDVSDEIEFLKGHYMDYDFVYLHIKKTDSYGEDGNFDGKVNVLEEFDEILPEIIDLRPDVLIITGDHSTPSLLKGHSWHPVPFILNSPYVFGGLSTAFTERECVRGELGIIPATSLMPLALANALRLKKFGA